MAKRPPAKSKQQHRPSLDERLPRDLILFLVGVAGIAHETIRYGIGERPFLITAFLGMMGLPVWLRKDERAIETDETESEAT